MTIVQAAKKVTENVTVSGRIIAVRDHGKIRFLDLQDYSGVIQVVIKDPIDLAQQYTVEITGEVKLRPENLINPELETGNVELVATSLRILSRSQELPFDLSAHDLDLSIDTLLDHRPLTLRNIKQQSIFKVQSVIAKTFGSTLSSLGFTQIFTPKIVSTSTEGGANLFSLDYFGKKAYLAQSPQFYKQIMAGVLDRVYEISPVFRAEEHDTSRHVNEYTSLDLEMAYIKSFDEIMAVEEIFLHNLIAELSKNCNKIFEEYQVDLPLLPKKIPTISLREAQLLIKKEFGRDNTSEPDLEPQDEKDLSAYFLENHKSDFVFVTHFPTSKRPFYAFPTVSDPNVTDSFDLIFRGVEITTGGQRIHVYEELVDKIKGRNLDPKNFDSYLEAFRYGMPPHGGLAIGLERLTAKFLNLDNVKKATLFPRDIKRITP